MVKTRLFFAAFVAASVFAAACSKSNGGGNWTPLDTGTSDAFFSINFVNEDIGWLNGQTDRGYVPPEDAGNENANANANKAPKPKATGKKPEDPLKANQGFEVLHTTDGGATWKAIPDQFKYKIRQVWFADPQTGWALTIDRDILHTADGGATWAVQRKAGKIKMKITGYKPPEMEQPEQLDNLRFIDAQHGWAWGGGRKDEYTEQPGTFLITTDGGQHWNETPFPFEQAVAWIFFLNPRTAWASTDNGGFYKTTDGGLNWEKATRPAGDLVYRSIFFADENNGWAVGRSGRMVRTRDGGKTWEKLYQVKDEFKMRAVYFIDRKRGWAVGDNGNVLYTADGGDEWLTATTPFPARLLHVVFAGERTGYAAGLDGTIWKYETK
ncbi:MAG: WD40/YVTN/BNR-like repeat-containing protein [Blastocatellia bacterium]